MNHSGGAQENPCTGVIGESSGAAGVSEKEKAKRNKTSGGKKNLETVAVGAIAIMGNKTRKRLKSLR